jgi:probable HAF family extracellular repeat protein
VVSGIATLTDGDAHPILWQNGLKRDLGTLGGLNSSAFGSPNAIGQVVGQAETSYSDPIAAVGGEYRGYLTIPAADANPLR